MKIKNANLNFLFFIFVVLVVLFSNVFLGLISFLTDAKLFFFFSLLAQFHLNFLFFFVFFCFFFFLSLTFKKKINFFTYSLYFYNFFSFLNLRQLLWYCGLRFNHLINFLVFEIKNNFLFFFLLNLLKSFSFSFWKPLFKRSSYFGYFRSTRTQWLN